MAANTIATREFGQSGQNVTIVGLGGEGILRTHGHDRAATALIHEAVKAGIVYFDSARAYAGSEGYYGQLWSKQPELRSEIFQASKSASRSKREALADLDGTLSRMRIDRLDLWQIHDVRTPSDLKEISRPGGALEGFLEAKALGKTRFIGVTGHHDPRVLTQAVLEWPVDSVMMPVNPVEGALGGFLDSTLTAAGEKGIAVIGMKVLGAGHFLSPNEGISPETLIRFALTLPIHVAIVGCSSPEHVQLLAQCGSSFQPLRPEESEHLVNVFRPYARRLAFYRGVF